MITEKIFIQYYTVFSRALTDQDKLETAVDVVNAIRAKIEKNPSKLFEIVKYFKAGNCGEQSCYLQKLLSDETIKSIVITHYSKNHTFVVAMLEGNYYIVDPWTGEAPFVWEVSSKSDEMLNVARTGVKYLLLISLLLKHLKKTKDLHTSPKIL